MRMDATMEEGKARSDGMIRNQSSLANDQYKNKNQTLLLPWPVVLRGLVMPSYEVWQSFAKG
jgi:hypothetical protein